MEKKGGLSVKNIYQEQLAIHYSNHVQFYASNWDFTFDVGMIRPPAAPSDKLEADIYVRVVMSPAHTKQFALKLMETIKNYEQSFGEISVGPKETK